MTPQPAASGRRRSTPDRPTRSAQKPRAPRVRLSAEERREQILDSAREVFFERGTAGTRMRDIADRAGITEPFFYRFFANKDEVYEETILEPLTGLVADLDRKARTLIESKQPFSPEQLASVHVMLLEFMTNAAPYLAVALFSDIGEGRSIYQREIYPKLRTSIVDVVDALSEGRMARFDPDLIFTMMLGVHLGTAFDHMLREVPIDVEKTAGDITKIYTSGLRDSLRTRSASGSRHIAGDGA